MRRWCVCVATRNFQTYRLNRRAEANAGPHGRALSESDGLTPRHESSRKRALSRVHTIAARGTRGRRCCIAPLHRYFESHDLRCSSKKARTCSGSSAPRNSTPAGSGSGQKTLSGVGTFGGLASMIFLLYKLIICLGPRFAPAPDAGHILCVALTAQADNETECLNRIYRLLTNALISQSPVEPLRYPRHSLPHLVPRAVQQVALVFADLHVHIGNIKQSPWIIVHRRISGIFFLRGRTFVNHRSFSTTHSAL